MYIEQIREDLKDIRFYYSMKETFEKGATKVKATATIKKVEKYNRVMENAPARLYILYVSLYLENNTQTSLADNWCYTREYIKDLNNKLCDYLLKEITKIDKENENG